MISDMNFLAVLKSVEYPEPEFFENERMRAIVKKGKCRLNVDLNFYDENLNLQSTYHYIYEGSGDEKEKNAIQNFLLGKYSEMKREVFAKAIEDNYRHIVGKRPFFVDIDNPDIKSFFDDLMNKQNWSELNLIEN